MLEHYVVFKPRPGREPELSAALAALSSGVADVPGLRDLTWGENTNASGLQRGFTHGCLGRFDDRAAFQLYWDHPAHEELMARLDDLCDERFAIDYSTEQSGGRG